MCRFYIQELSKTDMSFIRKFKLTARVIIFNIIGLKNNYSKAEKYLLNIPGKEGEILRNYFYRNFFKKLGDNVGISTNVHFFHPGKITIGNNSRINSYCYINGYSGVVISDDVLIGPYTMIHSANHIIPDKKGKIIESGYKGKIIKIGRDSLLSAHCCILEGVNVGIGSVIGAGSVVTKDTNSYTINAGVPSKKIGDR